MVIPCGRSSPWTSYGRSRRLGIRRAYKRTRGVRSLLRCVPFSPASAWKATFGIRNQIVSVNEFADALLSHLRWRALLVRLTKTDFFGVKIHFVELSGIEIPNRIELRVPSWSWRQVRFVGCLQVKQHFAAIEFKIRPRIRFALAGGDNKRGTFLRIFLQQAGPNIAFENLFRFIEHVVHPLHLIVLNFINGEIDKAPSMVFPNRHGRIALPSRVELQTRVRRNASLFSFASTAYGFIRTSKFGG